MSFFRPTITESSQDFLVAAFNAVNNDFVVGPYDFSKSNFVNARHPIVNNLDALILFDLPAEVIVYIDSTAIPGTSFDYYNPLLVNTRILERIQFVNRDTLKVVEAFQCNNLTSKTLNNCIASAMNTLIYYPPGFSVDYKNMTAIRSAKGRQISDFMSKAHQPPVLPIFPGFASLPFLPGLPIPLPTRQPSGNGTIHLVTTSRRPVHSHNHGHAHAHGHGHVHQNTGPTTQTTLINPMELMLAMMMGGMPMEEEEEDEEDVPDLEDSNAFNATSDSARDGQSF